VKSEQMINPKRNGPQALPTVLVAEVDTALREAIGFSLAAEGYEVSLFDSGEELLAAENLRDAACIVVNHRLPKMSGLGLIEAIAERRLPGRCILTATRSTPHMREVCRRLGVPILEKPLLGQSLSACIRGLLARPAAS
jgi:FixJ family two-component response regulator